MLDNRCRADEESFESDETIDESLDRTASRCRLPFSIAILTPEEDACARAEHDQHLPYEQWQEDEPIVNRNMSIEL
jgi:hypothetical protein